MRKARARDAVNITPAVSKTATRPSCQVGRTVVAPYRFSVSTSNPRGAEKRAGARCGTGPGSRTFIAHEPLQPHWLLALVREELE